VGYQRVECARIVNASKWEDQNISQGVKQFPLIWVDSCHVSTVSFDPDAVFFMSRGLGPLHGVTKVDRDPDAGAFSTKNFSKGQQVSHPSSKNRYRMEIEPKDVLFKMADDFPVFPSSLSSRTDNVPDGMEDKRS